MALSADFEAALVWAAQRHAGQRRHNTGTPYVGHLLATCAVVLEEGGGPVLAVAALLHDVLEDTDTTAAQVRERFGADVLRVVADCTDANLRDRAGLDWHERKRAHLDRLTRAPDDSLLVVAADKVCSLQSLVDDLVRFGPALFDRSARSATELVGNYRDVHRLLESRLGGRPVVRRLGALTDECAGLTAAR